MQRIVTALAICVIVAACEKSEKASVTKVVEKSEFYVSQPTDSEWPYRYTLIKTNGQWAGEIEIVYEGGSIFFDKMNVTKSGDQRIDFTALYGGIGKALPVDWELTLSKSGNDLEGLLVAENMLDEFQPVRLKFAAAKSVILPSSELEGKIRMNDDYRYRTEEALEYEVVMAKQKWERESKIAEKISEYRNDDAMRQGIRREWVGPAWVRDKVSDEDSKYFERIFCVYLGGTKVKDEDIQAISNLTELRELYLHYTGISDVSLESIGKLQSLRILHLGNTELTGAAVEKLRTTLPNTEIQW